MDRCCRHKMSVVWSNRVNRVLGGVRGRASGRAGLTARVRGAFSAPAWLQPRRVMNFKKLPRCNLLFGSLPSPPRHSSPPTARSPSPDRSAAALLTAFVSALLGFWLYFSSPRDHRIIVYGSPTASACCARLPGAAWGAVRCHSNVTWPSGRHVAAAQLTCTFCHKLRRYLCLSICSPLAPGHPALPHPTALRPEAGGHIWRAARRDQG